MTRSRNLFGQIYSFYICAPYCKYLIRNILLRFVTHILSQATKFAESPNPSYNESALNGVRSCVVGVVAAQDDTKADVIELNVRLAEEKDGRENTE